MHSARSVKLSFMIGVLVRWVLPTSKCKESFNIFTQITYKTYRNRMADEGLVQFLVLAKAAKGAACVALIQQVLSNKKIFVFGELLAMPNVQAVSW